MAVRMFLHCDLASAVIHDEITPAGPKFSAVDFEAQCAAAERQHEVGHVETPFCAAHVRPLLMLGEKGAVKARGNAAIKKKFGGKLGGHCRGCVRAAEGGKRFRTDPAR